jgi:hypothetical protein
MYKEIIGGASLLGIVLALFSYLYSRIGKVEENVVDCDLCQQRYNEMKNRLDKGEERFHDFEVKLDSNIVLLTRLEVKLDILMRNQNIKFNDSAR